MLGGLAARLDLTIENLEDLQIALDSILDGTDADGGRRHGSDGVARRRARDNHRAVAANLLDEIEREADEDGLGCAAFSSRPSTTTSVVDGDWVRLTKKVALRG